MAEAWYTDVSGLGKFRVGGASAELFVRTMTTADMLAAAVIGAVRPALLLNAEAEVIDVVELIRTGTSEFMLTCSAPVAEEAYSWLEAHGQLADEQGPVFAGLELSDESEKLAVLAVYGPATWRIIEELAGRARQQLMDGTQMMLVELQGLPVMLNSYPLLKNGFAEFFIPKQYRDILERLLLSFPELEPATPRRYRLERLGAGTWFTGAEEAAYQHVSTELAALIREEHDFVGARALGVGGIELEGS